LATKSNRKVDPTDQTEPVKSPDAANDIFLTGPQVKARYGNVSDMAIHRWLNHATMNFPRPIYIGERKYWRLSALVAYEQRAATVKHEVSEKHVSRRIGPAKKKVRAR
jgi:hypothetical protein